MCIRVKAKGKHIYFSYNSLWREDLLAVLIKQNSSKKNWFRTFSYYFSLVFLEWMNIIRTPNNISTGKHIFPLYSLENYHFRIESNRLIIFKIFWMWFFHISNGNSLGELLARSNGRSYVNVMNKIYKYNLWQKFVPAMRMSTYNKSPR